MTINILHLYPKEMNLYGDHGNVLALVKRCEWRDIKAKVIPYEIGCQFPDNVDIIFGGGGQDSGQSEIEKDLQRIAPKLKELIEGGTPALVICGIYQLFGQYFQPFEAERIKGIGIFDLYTEAGPTRLIGNTVINTPEFGEVVGYENHSGLTHLKNEAMAFGTIINGAGNNGEDYTEGIKYKNCIGTYLHGPLLPKNPRIADFMIRKAIENKTKKVAKLDNLNDRIENSAHKVAASRPR